MKIAVFIWPTLTSNYTIQGFSRARRKERPAHQRDVNTLQMLINDVWTPALQLNISELPITIHHEFPAKSSPESTAGFSLQVILFWFCFQKNSILLTTKSKMQHSCGAIIKGSDTASHINSFLLCCWELHELPVFSKPEPLCWAESCPLKVLYWVTCFPSVSGHCPALKSC